MEVLFLLRYSTTDPRCRLETETLLKNSYKCQKPSTQDSPYEIIKCTTEEIKVLEEYSVTIKSISILLNYGSDLKQLHNLHNEYKINGKIDISIPILLEKINLNVESYFFHKNFYGQIQKNLKKIDFFNEFEYFFKNKKINSTGTILELDITNENMQIFYLCLSFRKTARKKHLKFNVPSLPFMGRTSMNVEDSALMTNLCEIKPGMIVYDPCVGSGTLLLHSASRGCFVIGSDLNYKELTKGIVEGRTSINDNFKFLPFLGGVLADLANTPILYADRILADVPYGKRISLKGESVNEMMKKLENLGKNILSLEGIMGIWAPFTEKYEMDGFKLIRHYYEKSYKRSLFVYKKES